MVNKLSLFAQLSLLISPSRCFPILTAISSRRFLSTETMVKLSPLVDASGSTVTDSSDRLRNKRVGLYFAAGWCPMCTSFEPSLQKFRESAAQAGKDVELIYVPSDRSDSDAAARVKSLGMMSVPYNEADDYKTKYRVWAGSESVKLGTGRRSGVPALVVLDKNGAELAFCAAEAQGPKSLDTWPLDDPNGVWGE